MTSSAAVILGLALLVLVSTPPAPSQFPARLDTYFAGTAKLTAAERQRLAAGEAVTKLLDADEKNEVAVFGVIWIDAPMRRYVEAVQDIETFERGGPFKITKRVSVPPRLEDFAQLRLPSEDLAALPACRVGACEVKLGEAALKRFKAEIDWKDPGASEAANRLMRQLAFDYVTRYLQGGNESLAVYRDNSRPNFVAREFQSMIEAMPALGGYMPDLRRHLLEFPKYEWPNAKSFVYWQEAQFGLKPTIRISHLTVHEGADETVVASKLLYATHYFWTGLDLRVLVPDPSRGPGFWFVTVSRGRSDGFGGFAGKMVRGRVESEAQEAAKAALLATRRRLVGR